VLKNLIKVFKFEKLDEAKNYANNEKLLKNIDPFMIEKYLSNRE
jgi:hypothetical protein